MISSRSHRVHSLAAWLLFRRNLYGYRYAEVVRTFIARGAHTSLKFCGSALVLALLLVTGCTSMATVREDRARGEGMARDYAATDAHAWDASREVLREQGAATVEEDRSSGCLWAHFEAQGIATSTNVGVCMSPLEGGRTRVVCISRRHRQLTIATRLSEDGFHAALAAKLGGVQ